MISLHDGHGLYERKTPDHKLRNKVTTGGSISNTSNEDNDSAPCELVKSWLLVRKPLVRCKTVSLLATKEARNASRSKVVITHFHSVGARDGFVLVNSSSNFSVGSSWSSDNLTVFSWNTCSLTPLQWVDLDDDPVIITRTVQ